MAEARAARLAAAEARLAGTTTTTPTNNVEKKEEPSFEPTEKGDMEKKKEFTKLLFRGVVRDNGYKEAMGCVDVSPPSLVFGLVTCATRWDGCCGDGGHEGRHLLSRRARLTVESALDYGLTRTEEMI
jgi:hypothetical protein